MNRHPVSWRWRLVLIMTLVSGLALVSFIAISWQVVRITSLQKLDAEMVTLSLKEGWPFMLSLNPERFRPREPVPGAEETGQPRHGFSFYHRLHDRSKSGPDWPSELDATAIGRTVPGLYERQGKQLAKSRLFDLLDRPTGERPPPPDRRLRRPPRQQLPSLEQAVFLTAEGKDNDWRIMGFSDGTGVLLLASSMEIQEAFMASYRKAIFLSLPAALLLIGLVAWYFAGKAVIPVRRLTDAASGVTAEGLDRRLSQKGAYPEFAELIQVYNEMLDRLETSFEQSRRFSADAAHELNTPLTILQGHLDLLVQSANIDTESQQQLATIFEEVHNLREVVRKLLLLSLADGGRLPLEASEFDLSSMAGEIMEDAALIEPDLQVDQDIDPEILYTGDKDLIRQAILNVVSNAIKYNRPQGFVKLTLRRTGEWIGMEVTNAGEAIPPECADKLFDRFFRGDTARQSKAEGRGLGLSLAREFVKAHKGTLSLEGNETDAITFVIRLPERSF